MRSVWLPLEKEGKYSFENSTSNDEIPVHIIAENGSWFAVIGSNGHFMLNGTDLGKKIELHDRFLVMVVFGNTKYTLYAEYEHENDNVFIPYSIAPNSEISIGRLQDNDIFCSNPYISRNHAKLHWIDDTWMIEDQNSKNGIFVNGRHVTSSKLNIGDLIYIMGVMIILGDGFLCINNANERAQITTPKLREVFSSRDIIYSKIPKTSSSISFDRQPRKKYKLNPDPIEIEMPPMQMTGNKVPLFLRMGSPMVMGGRALMTGNVVSALTSLVFPAITQGLTEKDRKDYEKLRDEKYHEYLNIMAERIRNEIIDEGKQLEDIYPSLSVMLNYVKNRDRLWERRKIDEDFLSLRVGSGPIKMIAEKQFQPKKFELERDSLVDEMYALAEEPSIVPKAPIMVSLRDDYVASIVGDGEKSIEIVRNLIAQLVLTHSYDELKIMVLCNPEEEKRFNFLRYLPHNWDAEHSMRFLAVSRSDAQQLSKFMNNEFEELLGENGSSKLKSRLKNTPAYVFIVTSKELYDSVGILKKLAQLEEYSGVSIITAFDGAPKECTKMIVVGKENAVVDLVHPEVDDQPFVADWIDESRLEESMSELMNVKLKIDSKHQYSLPTMLSFLELYGAGRVEHLNPFKRWSDNNPVKSIAAPLGVGTDGKPFMLDLHEKKQGPHGLIAGGTGSGKSEFIITYILSMAVNYSPDEVAFVLIDYKGGGLAQAFVDPKRGIHLPHVVGTITNLDGAAIQRSLVSINSELKRRQAVFNKAKSETNEGTMDIYDYQKLYRNKRVSEPMPHLFIISDEFAELKKQEPEFMDELISIARIGRSLGVHLILATQKPSGVVNDQIWSNTRFRVCLKVATKNDSMEMLKRPEAAEIKNTGRFYLQVGYNELFELGQSAWCGAEYIPQDEVHTEADNSVQVVDNVGQVILNAKPVQKEKGNSLGKQIVSIVKYLSDIAARENIVPQMLWCEPLKPKIELLDLLEKNSKQDGIIESVIGMIDDPQHQTQFVYKLNMQSFHHMMICGASGSGKSSYLKTMLYSLVSRYSPKELNYYILDMSGGTLLPYSKLPHCGAYLTENNEADFDRLMSMLREMIAERKKLFAQEEVTNFGSYIQVKPLPMVLLVIDNFTMINSFSKGANLFTYFGDFMKECSSYGIKIIFTCNHLNEVHSRTRQEVDCRIALQAKDKYEYGDILDTRCNLTVPTTQGRGICIYDEIPMEFHTALLDCDLNEQERNKNLADRFAELSRKYDSDNPAKRLPMAEGDEPYSSFIKEFKSGRIPLGYSLKDMKRVALPLKQLECASIYFGNPKGTVPVFTNIITAAKKNEMDLIIIKKSFDSAFENLSLANELNGYEDYVSYFEATSDGMTSLKDRMMQEIVARNVFRDEYCEKNGIPSTTPKRARRAEKYIAEHTKPLMVIFESFGEICSFNNTEEEKDVQASFKVFFENVKGYNMFFIGGFYPDDPENLIANEMLKSFTKSHFTMLFGGRYDKQRIISMIPSEIRYFNKIIPQYDRFFMEYHDSFHEMRMPCGEVITEDADPDDAEIV